MKLSNLFYKCAYEGNWQTVGSSVNYKFVETVEHNLPTLHIYFQGSYQIMDWVRNFLFKKRPYKDMKIPYRVHRGFLAAWKEVEDIIIKKVTEKELIVNLNAPQPSVNTFRYKWQRIYVVGYSHGGALAGLCHECVWFHRPDLRKEGLKGYGFEAPRFYGGFKVKEELKERWASFTVVRTNNDIVTHCPPVLFRYTHVGSILQTTGDTSSVKKCLPKCIKSHYPYVVWDGLKRMEENKNE